MSVVTEVSEADAQSVTTLNRKAFGVCYKKYNTLDSNKKSQSDNETSKIYPEPQTKRQKGKGRLLSPIIREETPSCLLVATIGSANDSVINDTIERLSKSKDYDPDNIVNLLVEEAFNAKRDKDQIDSGINTREKTSQELNENVDAIENTPIKEIDLLKSVKKSSKVVSPTSDESNTEAISDTPNEYVNIRRKKKDISKRDSLEKNCFDVHVVEEFFSQHFTENREQEVIISPTLARKINETSSESSDDLLDNELMLIGDKPQNLDLFNVNNIEVMECLNNMVDTVCDEFNKCSEYLNKSQGTVAADIFDLEDDLPLKDIISNIQKNNTDNKVVNKLPQKVKQIKLKYKDSSKRKTRKTRIIKPKEKLELENTGKMSTIIEDNAETTAEGNVSVVLQGNVENRNENANSNKTADIETPMLRRKRKLFSPKDERITEEAPMSSQDNDFNNSKIQKTPKSTLSYKPYKDIEQERQRHIRMPRNRKSKKFEPPSPRTKKMNELFDKVKESSNTQQVKLIDRALEVYNFSTDSEEEFKEKKIAISKKNSNTIVGSEESTVLRRVRISKRTDSKIKNITKTQRVTRSQKKKDIKVEPVNDLIDEKMRKQKEVLDTSILVRIPEIVETAPVLVLENRPQMEAIPEKDEKSNIKQQQKTKATKKAKSKTVNIVKGSKKTVNIKPSSENDRTESPLPGLVVEEARTPNPKADGDLSANMVDKFKKICRNPEKYINESNNTQNLLSDNDKNMNSPQTINITDEFIELQSQTKEELRRNRKDPKTKKPTTVKPKRKAKENKIEKDTNKPCTIKTLSLPGSDTKSDQSIDSIGITGHGDSEEPPPSPKLIIERLEHRNLESEYLDTSTKDYFDKLTEAINNINNSSHDNSNENNKTTVINKSEKLSKDDKTKSSCSPQSLKSPLVSVERLSLEDISRWLPSRRNSESYTNSATSSKSKTSLKNIISSKTAESGHSTDSENDSDVPKTPKKSLFKENSPVFKIKHNGEHSGSLLRHKDFGNSTQGRIKCVTSKQNEPKRMSSLHLPRRVENTPKSCISPIKLFEDCIKNVDKLSHSTLSDDEDYINEIRETVAKARRRQIKSQSSRTEESIKKLSHAKDNEIQYIHMNLTSRITLTQTSDSGSIQDKLSTSTKIADCKGLKRKLEGDRDDCKKKKVEDNNNMGDFISASGNTESSVDEWFKRNKPSTSRGKTLDFSLCKKRFVSLYNFKIMKYRYLLHCTLV